MLFIDPSPTCMGACAKTIPKPQPRCMQCASDPSPTCMGACAYTEVMMENESPVAFCMQCASGTPSEVKILKIQLLVHKNSSETDGDTLKTYSDPSPTCMGACAKSLKLGSA